LPLASSPRGLKRRGEALQFVAQSIAVAPEPRVFVLQRRALPTQPLDFVAELSDGGGIIPARA
jgi:hypothetical protein